MSRLAKLHPTPSNLVVALVLMLAWAAFWFMLLVELSHGGRTRAFDHSGARADLSAQPFAGART